MHRLRYQATPRSLSFCVGHIHYSVLFARIGFASSAQVMIKQIKTLTVRPFPAAGSSANAGLKCGRSIRGSGDGFGKFPPASLSFSSISGMCSANIVR